MHLAACLCTFLHHVTVVHAQVRGVLGRLRTLLQRVQVSHVQLAAAPSYIIYIYAEVII